MMNICFREVKTDNIIRQAEMDVIPQEGSLIQFPRTGTYVVTGVTYTMSDDGNKMLDGSYHAETCMFVTIYLEHLGSYLDSFGKREKDKVINKFNI